MGTVPFDTLKMARKLEASGMDRLAARGIVEVMVDALAEAKSAIRPDTQSGGLVAYPVGSGSDAPSDGCGSSDYSARTRRHFTFQLGGLFGLWVWVTLLGFSYLLHYR
jgi:hypothetical protein